MLKTILFDLDGTLLELDLDYFLKQYFRAMAPKMASLMAPDEFIPNLLAATTAMIKNDDPDKTNEEAFLEEFLARVPHGREAWTPLFDEFYRVDFPALQRYTKRNPLARGVVETFMEKGYEVAVATQPVFPYLAIKHRLDWAGVGDLPFRLVSSYEEFHFCKPHAGYFQEFLTRLDRRPQECLMVGNDVDDDLPAGELGIQTYLLTDCLLNRRGRMDFRADYTGNMRDLYEFAKSLPRVESNHPE